MTSLFYRLDVRRPELRRVEVQLTFQCHAWAADGADFLATGVRSTDLFVPVWTPGSYLIREFARHLGPVVAVDADRRTRLSCDKVSKNRYRLLLPDDVRRVEISYSVHAHELTVRTADVTPDHAFWNHANLLLWPVAQPDLQAQIDVLVPVGWQVESPLPRVPGAGSAVTLEAGGLDEVMDSPCLAGELSALEWTAGDVVHRAVFEGLSPAAPPGHLLQDLRAVSEAAIAVFGKVPYRRYTFLCMFTDGGHGGLEHRDCSVLLAARTALRDGKSYRDFLGLAAHELFHAWNVKRMRPAELWSVDYEAENYTRMLWLAEGFTAYYDDLLCHRAGVLGAEDYLAILARNIGTMLGSGGRLRQSLQEASYDAWIRFYRPDENTRNSTQNYYVNGSLVALCWDLSIRAASSGARSLDDFMRALWQQTFECGRGYTMQDVESCLREVLGGDQKAAAELLSLVEAPLQLELRPRLERMGLRLLYKEQDKPYLGIGFREGGTTVAYVLDDSPASIAGVAPGDEVIALDDLRVTHESWPEVFPTVAAVGQPLRMLINSRGKVRELRLLPREAPIGACAIELMAEPAAEALALRNGWLREAAAQDAAEASEPRA